MKYLILLLCATFLNAQEENTQSLSLDILGFSDHSNHYVHYNQTNDGIGASYAVQIHPEKDHTEGIFSIGTYKDSMDNRATYALVGLRTYLLGSPSAFNIAFSLSGGFYHGSGAKYFAMIPVISVGYDIISLCATGMYSRDQNSYNEDGSINRGHCGTSVIAAFLEFKVLTF